MSNFRQHSELRGAQSGKRRSLAGLRVTRAVLAEAASARYGTLWMVDEPWLLAIIGA